MDTNDKVHGNGFKGLPNELVAKILSYCDDQSLANIARVSKHVNKVTLLVLYHKLTLIVGRRPNLVHRERLYRLRLMLQTRLDLTRQIRILETDLCDGVWRSPRTCTPALKILVVVVPESVVERCWACLLSRAERLSDCATNGDYQHLEEFKLFRPYDAWSDIGRGYWTIVCNFASLPNIKRIHADAIFFREAIEDNVVSWADDKDWRDVLEQYPPKAEKFIINADDYFLMLDYAERFLGLFTAIKSVQKMVFLRKDPIGIPVERLKKHAKKLGLHVYHDSEDPKEMTVTRHAVVVALA